MPVEDLIRYFNAADRDGDSLLYPKAERVEAWHHGLHLGSLFQPIVDLRNARVVGHRATLDCRQNGSPPVDAETAYALCDSEQSVIHLDRLCRTLHALNFLAQQRSTGGWLQLTVHPRHLLAVQSQHGLVYEAILKRCGLAPEDIVLELDASAIDAHGRFALALNNYRQRGYRVALNLGGTTELSAAFALHPDLLRLSTYTRELVERAGALGIECQLAGVDDERTLQSIRRDGIGLASGRRFGVPAADCQATHKAPVKSYNPASPQGVHHENRQ